MGETHSDMVETQMNNAVRTSLLLASILLPCITAGPVSAKTIYVDNQIGSDRFDGISSKPTGRGAGPVETIRRATELAGSGGRIVVANTGQPYYENVVLFGHKNSGTRREPFRIEGQGATLDGTVAIPDSAWESVGNSVFRYRPTLLSHQMLYNEGRPLPQVFAKKGSLVRPRLEPGQWCYHDGTIYFRVEGNRLPETYRLRCAGHGAGLLLYRVDHVEISGLTIQGFQLDGIQAADAVSKISLVGLNLRGNGRSGISVQGASRITASQCLVGNNGRAQVRVDGYCKANLDDCDVLDNTAAPFVVSRGKLFVDGKPYPSVSTNETGE